MGNLLSSGVDYLKEALKVLNELENANSESEQLNKALKEMDKEIYLEEKSLKDEIDSTIKARKEDITVSFDKSIRKDQEKIRKIRSERDKAKSKGIAGRIEVETTDIREENSQIQNEIRIIIKEKNLPRFCAHRLYYIIFYPKNIVECLVFFLGFVICLFAVPYSLYTLLPTQNPFWMLVISFICNFIYFMIYQTINTITKIKKWDAICRIRALYEKLTANHKKIKAIRNAILKDKDEKEYNLEGFDKQIEELEKEIKTSLKEKQEALTVFETSTQKILTEEIQVRYRPKIDTIQKEQEQTALKLKEADDIAKEIQKHLTSEYEALLGKEYVNYNAVCDMIQVMEEGRASTVAEALALYKEGH